MDVLVWLGRDAPPSANLHDAAVFLGELPHATVHPFGNKSTHSNWALQVPILTCSAAARVASTFWKHFTIKKTLEKFNFSSNERRLVAAAGNGPVSSKLSNSHCRFPFTSEDASKSSNGSGEDGLEDLNPILISSSTSSLSNIAAFSTSLCLFSRSSWVLTYITEQCHHFAIRLQKYHQSRGMFLYNQTRLISEMLTFWLLQSEITKPLNRRSLNSDINFAYEAPEMVTEGTKKLAGRNLLT